jgi:hypothetical protein
MIGGNAQGGDGFFVGGVMSGAVSISLGSGNDRFSLGISGGAAMSITLGSGNDSITLHENELSSLTLDGGYRRFVSVKVDLAGCWSPGILKR